LAVSRICYFAGVILPPSMTGAWIDFRAALSLIHVVISQYEMRQITGQDLCNIMDEQLHHLLRVWFLKNWLKGSDCLIGIF
jgi:hypothetical protein